MHYAFRNAGKLDEETKKKINEILDKCKICKKNSKSKSKPTETIPKAREFNSTVVVDLKINGDKYIIWTVCACTRFIQGRVLNYKNPESCKNIEDIG